MSQRVLFAITVYNGGDVVTECLRSAAKMSSELFDTDVLILDDASSDSGFSADIRSLCAELGLNYYCTPRNLGIPRNFNIGMLSAYYKNYDYVVIANSDVIFASNLIDRLASVFLTDPQIGSVTAWSNNVSIYSIPNEDAGLYLANQETVDWVGKSLAGYFHERVIDIPTGIGFCLCIPSKVIEHVGLMDPIYGRGYCEETDWCLRAKSLGYRNVLAASAFAFHQGQASTRDAGMLAAGHTTVPAHERIIDYRYPNFRDDVDAFIESTSLKDLSEEAIAQLVIAASHEFSYEITIGHLHSHELASTIPQISIEHNGLNLTVFALYKGFQTKISVTHEDILAEVINRIGREPSRIRLFGAELMPATILESARRHNVSRELSYPVRV